MKIESKTCILKNKTKVCLRSPKKEDAEQMLRYFKQVSSESENMVSYPKEVTYTLDYEENFLEAIENSERNVMIAAFMGNEIVGNAALNGVRESIKLKHRSTMGIAIFQKVQGIGLGSLLMDEIIEKAESLGYEQLELEVSAENERAVSLYRKKGFKECGRIPNGFKLESGHYVDLIMMVKFLNKQV